MTPAPRVDRERVRRSLAQQEEYRVREPESREPGTEAGRRLMAGRYSLTVDSLLRDVLEVEAEARQQGRDPDVDRLTRAIQAAVGSPHPDDFGISYRDKRGFSPSGLAAAILAAIDALPVDARRALASADGPPNLTDEEHVAAGHAFRNDADGGHWEADGPPEPGIDVEPTPNPWVTCGIDGCDYTVERGEGRHMALHREEDHPARLSADGPPEPGIDVERLAQIAERAVEQKGQRDDQWADDLLDAVEVMVERLSADGPPEPGIDAREIAEAKPRRSKCPTPDTCMYPQRHSDDEWSSEYARLSADGDSPGGAE